MTLTGHFKVIRILSLCAVCLSRTAASSTYRSSHSATRSRWAPSASCTAWCFIGWGPARRRRRLQQLARREARRQLLAAGSPNVRLETATQRRQVAARRQNVASQDSSSSLSSSSPSLGYRHRYIIHIGLAIHRVRYVIHTGMHRVKWRQSSLWLRYDLHAAGYRFDTGRS